MATQNNFGTVSDDDYLAEGYFNGLQKLVAIVGDLYTGTDLNTTTQTTNNHTIQLSASDIGDSNYIEVNITFSAYSSAGGASGACSMTLQVERNETGESSWSDVLATTTITSSASEDGTLSNDSVVGTIKLLILLTAGEKTNGIDIKFTVTGAISSGETASFTIKQIYFKSIQ